ncbi:hypothetical protein NL676_004204 [Syzygium grande]|nr:hypothetical protein NL676_004204 [Syzygium grande]
MHSVNVHTEQKPLLEFIKKKRSLSTADLASAPLGRRRRRGVARGRRRRRRRRREETDLARRRQRTRSSEATGVARGQQQTSLVGRVVGVASEARAELVEGVVRVGVVGARAEARARRRTSLVGGSGRRSWAAADLACWRRRRRRLGRRSSLVGVGAA